MDLSRLNIVPGPVNSDFMILIEIGSLVSTNTNRVDVWGEREAVCPGERIFITDQSSKLDFNR